jgi:predicted anti-sigma-YlaC factor YlaD
MSSDHFSDAISALADGTLDPAERPRVEAHVETCAECRALLADLRALRQDAARLAPEPLPASLWPRLAARLREQGVQGEADRGRRQAPWQGMAVAAVLALAIGAALFVAWSERAASRPAATHADASGNGTGDSTVLSVEAELRLAAEHYERAIQGLEEIATAADSPLEPQVAETVKRNLQVIDQAIAESRSALKLEPQNQPARESLFEALRRKVTLLQDSIALMNEMRKGNQAGAAQIGEGLSKAS